MSDTPRPTPKEIKADFNGIYIPFFFIAMWIGYIYHVCYVGLLIGISKAEGN